MNAPLYLGATMQTRQQLRQIITPKRAALSISAQETAALQLCSQMLAQPVFQRSQRIAFYRAHGGEISVDLLLSAAFAQQKQCYLSALDPLHSQQLAFISYMPGDPLIANRFKICEPEFQASKVLAAAELDLVLVPLVACDRQGNRLGRGAGFYDRTFAFLTQQDRALKPYLLGVAYEWQLVDVLPAESWDVPVNALATDQNYHSFGTT